MPQFSADVNRRDPYKNMKFRVYFGKETIVGASKVSALTKTITTVEFRSGGDLSSPRIMPTVTKYAPVTIEIPLTHDVLAERLSALLGKPSAMPGKGLEMSLGSFRGEMFIEVLNEAGQPALRYKLTEAWISEFQALPELDANGNAVAVQHLVVQHHGFERVEMAEPTPPTY